MSANNTLPGLADGQSDSDLLAATSDGTAGVQLTPQERRLIANFRAMKSGAKKMMVDLSAEMVDALPANQFPLSRCWFVSGRPNSATGGQHPQSQ